MLINIIMKASLEPIAAVIRVHADGHNLGDPYTWSGTVVFHEDCAEFVGVMRAPKPSEYRAIKRVLKEWGYNEIFYERKNVALEREVRRKL